MLVMPTSQADQIGSVLHPGAVVNDVPDAQIDSLIVQ